MGIFNFWKNWKKSDQVQTNYAAMLNNNYPIFSQFGNNIYASDVVQQAIYCIVTEMKKLNPKHIRKDGFDTVPVWGDVQRVLDDPNPLMTTSDFIEKITWQVMLNYNAFIYIQRDREGKLTGLFPISPLNVSFLESAGRLYCEMLFKNGESYTLPYSSLIHIKTHFSVDDLMGGNENGQPDNYALLETLDLNNVLLQGVKKSLKSSFAINGIVKYNTMLDNGKMEAAIKEFEEKLAKSDTGILGIDNKAEVVQFKRDLKVVDEPTLKFIDEKILRFFGVPKEILLGNYTTEVYEAFYQRTLEPLIINYSQSFSKALFSSRQMLGYDNKVMFYPKELVFMSMGQKLEMVHELGQSGTLYENEKRVIFGYEPLEELKGVRLQSLNYVNVEDARQYQVGEPKEDEVKDNGTE